jgi:hypothetical protein
MNQATIAHTGWRGALPGAHTFSFGIVGGSILGILAKFGAWTSARDGEEFGRSHLRNFAFMYVVLIIAAGAGLWARRSKQAAIVASIPALFGAVLIVFAIANTFGSASGLLPGGFFMGCAATSLLIGSIQAIAESMTYEHQQDSDALLQDISDLRRELARTNQHMIQLQHQTIDATRP